MELSVKEQNYIKTIYTLCISSEVASNKHIAKNMGIQPSAVSDMLKRLAKKKIVHYTKYQGVKLSKKGIRVAMDIIRKHRIWEVFLYEKLNFKWDEVHEIAEQLEHINSTKLIDNLESYLGYPTRDPHGDPIPNKEGVIYSSSEILLQKAKVGEIYYISQIKTDEADLLTFLEDKQLLINTKITILNRQKYDNSITIELCNGYQVYLSEKMCKKIYVTN